MPTAAERQALAFLAGVALLGGSVQVWRSQMAERDGKAEIAAIGGESAETQLRAIDSLRQSRVKGKRSPRKSSKTRAGETIRARTETADVTPLMVDVDIASAEELERLPRVGPALAQRIVADRDSLGQFGSLEELGRVRGIGPAMLKLLAPVTTFSGRVRSFPSRQRNR